MNEEHEFEIEIEAQPGDLVEVDGYPGYYFVEGYIVQHHVFNNEEYTEVVYELTNAHYGDWLEADVEDLTFVADAGQADEFLRTMPKPAKPDVPRIDIFDILKYETGAVEMAGKQERKLTAREQSAKIAAEKKEARKKKAEMVDRALDGRLIAGQLAEMFPDEQARYERRVAKYDAFLGKLNI